MSRPVPPPMTPYRDLSVTAEMTPKAARRTCPICGTPPVSRRATFCSHRCQMIAFRRRNGHQQLARELTATSLATPPRDHVVYECSGCQTRLLGEQRCDDCNRFARRLGPGGQCPGCSDIVTVEELLQL